MLINTSTSVLNTEITSSSPFLFARQTVASLLVYDDYVYMSLMLILTLQVKQKLF